MYKNKYICTGHKNNMLHVALDYLGCITIRHNDSYHCITGQRYHLHGTL